ncbi:hypothetical protein PZA11_002984 [Diplocarpon coronariae]|uniref:Yeast cell wall synthesis Kre9/Knh1-like N-terminal domain-containing protein n=1 Tax=Diplocarpon coronariae TaxID=2795749 RepID=A0A218Z4N9_9HELO|nr:hypothetical protein B2J93_3655 [Marssonina coronariae]
MQFTFAVVAAATLSFANAAVQLTNGPSTFSSGVAAGTPLEITWSGAEGPVTLTLKSGESTNLKTVETIVSGQSGTSYTWTPSTSLPEGTYALQIDDSTGVPNYSVQFAITGGAASSSPSSVSSTASSSHASSGYPVSKTDSSSSSTSSSYSTTSSTGPYTTAAPTYSGNSTSTSSHTGTHTNATSTKTSSSSRSSGVSSTSVPTGAPNSNSAPSFASPLAFACLVFAALITLN